MLSSAAIALSPPAAMAADLAIDVSYEAAPAPAPSAATMFDVAFGVTLTSEYISRGVSLSDGPAIQPWAELSAGLFYVGYWGSNVTDGAWEHDLSVGIRPEFGPFAFDFGYVRYLYSNGGDCCGELYGIAEYSGFDPLTVGALVYYDPASTATYVEANAAVSLPHDLSASGAFGVQTDGGGGSDMSWNAGLSWDPYDFVSFDARYHGGPASDKFVVSVSLSSALSALNVLKPN